MTWLIAFGILVLLLWKAPHVAKGLAKVAGALALVLLAGLARLWLYQGATERALGRQFDADPRSENIPADLHLFYRQGDSRFDGAYVFNSSLDTANSCRVRGVTLNAAGVKIGEQRSQTTTFQPLSSERPVSWHRGTVQIADCTAKRLGDPSVATDWKGTTDALLNSPDFALLPLTVRLGVFTKVGAPTTFLTEYQELENSWTGVAIGSRPTPSIAPKPTEPRTHVTVRPSADTPPGETESPPGEAGTSSLAASVASLSRPEQQSIEAACSRAKYTEGPAAYNRCLQDQLQLLIHTPQ